MHIQLAYDAAHHLWNSHPVGGGDILAGERKRCYDLRPRQTRGQLVSDSFGLGRFADHQTALKGRGPPGNRPRNYLPAKDQNERGKPNRRDPRRAQAAAEQDRLKNRQPQGEQPRELGEQRHLVQRRVHEAQLIPIVETQDLEEEQQQRNAGESKRRDAALTEYVQQHDKGHACRGGVSHGEQPSIERRAPDDRIDAFVVFVLKLLVCPGRRRCNGRESESRAGRGEVASRLPRWKRHADASLRRHTLEGRTLPELGDFWLRRISSFRRPSMALGGYRRTVVIREVP